MRTAGDSLDRLRSLHLVSDQGLGCRVAHEKRTLSMADWFSVLGPSSVIGAKGEESLFPMDWLVSLLLFTHVELQ